MVRLSSSAEINWGQFLIGVSFQLIHACLPTTVGSSAAHRHFVATFATQ